jgi:hypothetical protein
LGRGNDGRGTLSKSGVLDPLPGHNFRNVPESG